MATSLQTKINKLSSNRKLKIKQRAKELIDEELSLKSLRELMQLTQKEMAKKLDIGQDGVSRLEKRSDILLSTLRKYIVALGGDIELVVKLPNKPPLNLANFSDLDKTDKA